MILSSPSIAKLYPIKPPVEEEARLAGIEHSIRTLGLIVPLIINEDRKIIDGNRRWYVLRKMYGNNWQVKAIMCDVPEEKVWTVHTAINACPLVPIDPAKCMITAASETVKWQILSQLDFAVSMQTNRRG